MSLTPHIETRADVRDLDRVNNTIGRFIRNTTVRIAAPIAISAIKRDAAQGRGYKGAWRGRAKEYSPEYAARRRGMGLSITPVTLLVSGEYLDGLHLEANVITAAAGKEGQAVGLDSYRPHLGVSASTAKEASLALVRALNRLT